MEFPLADEILRHLLEARGSPVSGQRMASRLGVTRAAVWKGVVSLRGNGYRVESIPARGYRLTGGPNGVRPGEVAFRLQSRRMGRPLHHLDSVDSTNREAERRAAGGTPEGTLVLAEHQTAGRGRLGRTWLDSPRDSLLFSLVLRPAIAPAMAPPITYVAAASLAETLAGSLDAERIAVKWPNDVLVDGRKVAGILLEMRCEGLRVDHVILGVGVNVEGRAEDLPGPLSGRPATLAEVSAGGAPNRRELLCAFLETFEGLYDEFLREGVAAVLPRWNRWFRAQGTVLRVRTASRVLEGTARGLDADGALLLEVAGAGTQRIFAGEIDESTTRET